MPAAVCWPASLIASGLIAALSDELVGLRERRRRLRHRCRAADMTVVTVVPELVCCSSGLDVTAAQDPARRRR
jgi:hypothetical protein